jgi:F-type H+-transporting ATPase subunit b
MRYIWPPMLRILEEREKEIADGLNAASEGKRELEEASVKKKEILKDAKEEAAELINQAGQRANQLVEDAKTSAQKEAEKIKVSAQNDLEQSTKRAREELRSEVATLAVAGAEKILNSEIDEKKNSELIDELTKEL